MGQRLGTRSTTANVVGSIMNVPSLYTFQGRELICANGRAWVSSPQYRSFALILMDEYFNQDGADLFINTTISPMALNILGTNSPCTSLSAIGNRSPIGSPAIPASRKSH